MKSIASSEASFKNQEEVNFRKNKRLYFLVNIISIISFPVFYLILFGAADIFLSNKPSGIFYYFILFSGLSNGFLFLFLAILFIFLSLHELVHGLFFYIFTGAKPVFGFKNLSAYAGTPDYYISKNNYLIACLSPFVILTLAGSILFFLSSGAFATIMFIIVSAHAAGCVGDFWLAIKLINKPNNTYINDDGMVIKIGYDLL